MTTLSSAFGACAGFVGQLQACQLVGPDDLTKAAAFVKAFPQRGEAELDDPEPDVQALGGGDGGGQGCGGGHGISSAAPFGSRGVPGYFLCPGACWWPSERLSPGTRMSPRHTQVAHESCPAVREVLHMVGDKWSVLVVVTLGQGPRRFSELRRGMSLDAVHDMLGEPKRNKAGKQGDLATITEWYEDGDRVTEVVYVGNVIVRFSTSSK